MSASVAYFTTLFSAFSEQDQGASADFAAQAQFRELLDRIRSDDQSAFQELLLALASPLEAYARRFSGSLDTAKDIVQDVFAHLWEQRASLVVRGSVRGYLYTSVRNRAIDIRRRTHAEIVRWAVFDEDHRLDGVETGTSEIEIERQEIAERVREALATLPPRAREAALLRWADGLSRTEVAMVMGIALGTVKAHLTLAATTIRTLLADLGNPPEK